MKTRVLLSALLIFFCFFAFAQDRNTKIFTIFTSGGCGCTGSGGAPENFTTHDEVLSELRQECEGIDFLEWNDSYEAALDEMEINKDNYDGVLIIGRMTNDQRLAFTGLPTIVVYNLFEFMGGQPYYFFATGKSSRESVLEGGTDYENPRILTAQLDRRNLSAPDVTEAMFNDLVYKIKLIQKIKELKKTRILMIKRRDSEPVAAVNYKGDYNQSYPENFDDLYINNLKELLGIEIVPVRTNEFYETYKNIDVKEAEKIADEWIRGARKVEASKREIIKTARGYLAHDALREKYNCNAVSSHVKSVDPSGKPEFIYNAGLGFELGFKTRGIQATCQNYPDILIAQILGYQLSGRPGMLGDFIYDIANSVEIVLHCGIPVNPYGDDRRIPYTIRTHAQSPYRNEPEKPGSSTGMTAEWPVGESVTFWEFHTLNKEIRLNTGVVVDSHALYSGGEDIDNVMCTAKVIAKVDDMEKLAGNYRPDVYGIHTTATLGDLRKQIKDIAVLLGFEVVESDR